MPCLKIAFRTDASLQIGSGHVMRCLTLADALTRTGAECRFICREHEGNLINMIQSEGHLIHALPISEHPKIQTSTAPGELAHAAWLGATQKQDATECAPILSVFQPDWLILDHYALDARWEQQLSAHFQKLMVIDDLADRSHICDLLLDQTFGRAPDDYALLVPKNCSVLCGSQYALLRPSFAASRPDSLQRRERPLLQHLLITMGGVDKDNATGRVLEVLRDCLLPWQFKITIVMGPAAPWLAEVTRLAENMPWPTTVRIAVNNMAELMAESDLAIGAAGATSWERCCLGLPTLMLVLADNQRKAANSLQQAGAVQVLSLDAGLPTNLKQAVETLLQQPHQLRRMIDCSSLITDGRGLQRILAAMNTVKPFERNNDE